jgi:hypothetical protein
MDHSKTVYLNTAYQAITGLSPFTLTINPSDISTSNKVYKLEYDFGDGTIVNQVLTTEDGGDPLSIQKTHVYYLTGNLQKTFNINVNAYQFNTSLYSNYKISLNLKVPFLESIVTSNSALSSTSYFDELHLVGSRMFGTDNEILYMFESINPNYILPVMVNWKSRPLETIIKTIDNSYAPYKLLAPFENEATTSIDTGTNIVTYPDVNAAPNPDYGSPDMALYEGDGIATMFLGTIDGNWFNLANWTTDGGNNPLFLPDEYVSVKIYSPLNVSAVNVGKVKTIDFYQNSLLSQLTVMAAQSAIFRSNSYNLGTIDGDAYFLDNSYNQGFEPTLLLLEGEGADGSSTFTDSSTYNRILTYTGNPIITSVPVTPNTLVTDGLAFQVDAYGYVGDGSTWVDTVSGVVGTAQNSPTYVADSPSYFDFSGASQCFNFTRYNSAVNLNNNFTLETWVNVRGNNEWGGIISLATGGYEYYYSGGGEQYSLNTTSGQRFRFNVNGSYLGGSYLDSITYTLNNWTHIVTTFESGVVKTYKNGTLADTQTIASTANTIEHAYLALGVNQFGGFEYFNGKIATARIYNKVLSSTEASQNFNATKERFGMNRPIGSFMYFDGNSSLTPVSGGNDFAFGVGDFTIEAWIYPTRDNETSQVFYDTRIGGYGPYPVIYLRSGTYLTFFNGWGNVIEGGRISLYDWTHVAVSRKQGKSRLFLNGVQTGGTANDTSNYQSNTLKPIIGGAFDNYNFKGFIEDVRVTKGIAKYTENYTLPTSALTVDPYITGDVTGTAFFNDNSINYGTLTNTVFSGNSQNFGTVTNAAVWYPVTYPLSGSYTNINYYGYPSLSAGLLGYWKFDELSGNRIDSTGNGNLITETNGTVIYDSNGVINNAAYITDGNNTSWLSISAGVCDPHDQPKSYSLWFNLDQTNVGYQWLLCQGESTDQRNINPFFIENNSTLTSVFTTNGFYWTNTINTSIVPTANEWHHAVLTLNGSVAKLYYNGALVGSTNYSGTIQSTDSQFTLGHYNAYPNGVYGTEKFVGKVDEFGIWNRELSLSEISFIYNNKVARGLPYPYPYNQ